MLGSGTVGDPYIIQDVNDLQNMNLDLAAYYELGHNIDASATVGWNGGAGFEPVGTLGTPFTGSLDGKGYTITGLVINRPLTDDNGLFGYTDGATIENVTMAGVSYTVLDDTGALVGESNNDTITNCHSSGQIDGDDYIGGLIGFSNNSTISKCSSSCVVNGDDYIGGLVGWSYQCTVSRSYATGNVTGTDDYVGGLMGVSQEDDIDDCYARGVVVGDQYIGGLIGYCYDGTGAVDDCYSTGAVTGNTDVGGLMGFCSAANNNCFWDIQTSGQTASAAGTGERTSQMKRKITFLGWDMGHSSTYRNDGYPFLSWEIGSSSTWLIYGLVGNGNGNGDGDEEPEPEPEPGVVKPTVATLPATGVS